jgi:alcohol dehydrogenase class IV
MIAPFGILAPGRILFGRGSAAGAQDLILAMGRRVLLVHGRDAARAGWLVDGLAREGAEVCAIGSPGEPTLDLLVAALAEAQRFSPTVVVALGGGAAIDLGKALAALVPATGAPLDHLEVVGPGLPLTAEPLPFVALPTTAGTGAEATRNAVIGVPERGRKVSLRDDRLIARLAIVDPALTDNCPRAVTLASGLDAVVQVIEPYLSTRANPFTDALCREAIPRGLAALHVLAAGEDAAARDAMAWVSLAGGLALGNAGLGAVHALAGVIGGRTGAAHGALCGALLPHVLRLHASRLDPGSRAGRRLAEVQAWIGAEFAGGGDALASFEQWMHCAGLPRPSETGLSVADHAAVARDAEVASSMRSDPSRAPAEELERLLAAAG